MEPMFVAGAGAEIQIDRGGAEGAEEELDAGVVREYMRDRADGKSGDEHAKADEVEEHAYSPDRNLRFTFAFRVNEFRRDAIWASLRACYQKVGIRVFR